MNFLKKFYPNNQGASPHMMFNFHQKCKDLQCKYGSLGNVPSDQANAVFIQQVMKILLSIGTLLPSIPKCFLSNEGDIARSNWGLWWSDCSVEKVKHCQGNGYDFGVFYAQDGHPAGMMYTMPYPWQVLCHSDLNSMDWQLKRKNTYGWVFCGPAGTNNNKKIVHFVHLFMIAELMWFAEFLLTSMSEISGRSMKDIKVVAMDGKIDQKSFCKTLTFFNSNIYQS